MNLVIHIVDDHANVIDLNRHTDEGHDHLNELLDALPVTTLFHSIRRKADIAEALGVPTEWVTRPASCNQGPIAPAIKPCDPSALVAARLEGFCPSCDHVVLVHEANGYCSVCRAVALIPRSSDG